MLCKAGIKKNARTRASTMANVPYVPFVEERVEPTVRVVLWIEGSFRLGNKMGGGAGGEIYKC